MELTNDQVISLFTRLGGIEARLGGIEDKLETPGPSCAVHTTQIQALSDDMKEVKDKLSRVQTVIGKKELIVAAFGAIGFGIAWALKAMLGLGK